MVRRKRLLWWQNQSAGITKGRWGGTEGGSRHGADGGEVKMKVCDILRHSTYDGHAGRKGLHVRAGSEIKAKGIGIYGEDKQEM